MEKRTHLSKKNFYRLLILCGGIILIGSLQVLIETKDRDLFDLWLKVNYEDKAYTSLYLQEYIAINITTYYIKILSPLIILVTSYLTLKRFYLIPFYLYMWIILSFGGLAYNLVGLAFNSIFFYLNIFFYVSLIIYIFIL